MVRGVLAILWAGAVLLAAAGGPDRAQAEVVISINKARQSMSVLVDGREKYHWVVSTGVGGGPISGTYRPGRMERKWASRKYNMAPMPHSIFFDGNYAIHGTVKVSQLGRRASKGCVRLHPANAATLFELVLRHKADTSIVVSNATHVAAREPSTKTDAAEPGASRNTVSVVSAEPAPEVVSSVAAPVRSASPRPRKKVRQSRRAGPYYWRYARPFYYY